METYLCCNYWLWGAEGNLWGPWARAGAAHPNRLKPWSPANTQQPRGAAHHPCPVSRGGQVPTLVPSPHPQVGSGGRTESCSCQSELQPGPSDNSISSKVIQTELCCWRDTGQLRGQAGPPNPIRGAPPLPPASASTQHQASRTPRVGTFARLQRAEAPGNQPGSSRGGGDLWGPAPESCRCGLCPPPPHLPQHRGQGPTGCDEAPPPC